MISSNLREKGRRSMKWKIFLVFLFSVFLSGTVQAQNLSGSQMQSQESQQQTTGMEGSDYSPMIPPAFSSPGLTPVLRQPLDMPPAPEKPIPRPRPPVVERPSEFEQFVAEKIEITEAQFEILKKDGGIAYTQNYPPVSEGKISVPVKIVRTTEKGQALSGSPPAIGVGFLTGTPEAIAGVFKLLGIRSRYAITTELKQFGYDFFLLNPDAFPPADRFPVGPEYVLGPGDEVRVTIWGKVEGRFNLFVDRDGMIRLPKVGVVSVAGLPFKEAKELIQKEYSKYFSGFEMNVSMGALRTITVYVVGNAQWPGAYTISSLSTIVNAMFAAGGPNKNGSMRDIQVKRDGRETVHFDLYDLLLKGDKSNDIRLMPQDVDFIPPIGPVAAIAGSVNNPALYELKSETKISQLVEMAGGMNTVAFKGRIQIERIVEKALEGESGDNLPLRENDYLFVRTVPEWKLYQTVTISGEVKYPGTYTIRKGEKLSSLITRAGGFTDRAYLKGAVFTRERVREIQQKQLDESADRLEREMAARGTLAVAAASSPEEAQIKSSETQQMKGFLAKVRQAKAKGRLVVPISDIGKGKGATEYIELEEGDSLFIPANPQSVQVSGSVFNQTAFVYDGNKGISDYIKLAGGYTENADKKRIYFLKVDGTAVRPEEGFSSIFWSKTSSQWESGGKQLDPGDTIVVPEQLERIAWMREIKDITQILYQIAVTAGVLLVAF